MQLLYVANRHERKQEIDAARGRGTIVVCDRYIASSVAYGEAQGLDATWLANIQRYLPQPDLTILLDIPPEVSARRKRDGRDRYEQDLALLARVRDSYLRQAAGGWLRVDGDRDRDAVAAEIWAAVGARL
jgi:dTMP kinase